MMTGASDNSYMAEFASLLWSRYIRDRVREELLHSLQAYRAEVVTNNGDGTLTVQRPFEPNSITLKCVSSLSSVAAGAQVLVVGIGDKSNALTNAFVLCKADLSNL